MAIRPRTYRNGNIGWQLDMGIISGKRWQRSYPTRVAAETTESEMKAEKKSFGESAVAMSHADRLRYAAAAKNLEGSGASIEQAVEWALERSKAIVERVDVTRLKTLYIADRVAMQKRPRYVKQLRVALGALEAAYGDRPAAEIRKGDVETWLRGNGWAPLTQKSNLGSVGALFNWAISKRLAMINPAKGVELPDDEEREISVFTPAECLRLLTLALNQRGEYFDTRKKSSRPEFLWRPLLGYITLALFGGIRPEEVKRSPASVIDLDHGHVLITGARAKTRRRRVVEMPANAVTWLKQWRALCPEQAMIMPKNFHRLWLALREKAGLMPWPQDVLRHTFATMDYALHQDTARLQAKLGHSRGEDTLFTNYRAVTMRDGGTVSKAIATEFFALTPSAAETL